MRLAIIREVFRKELRETLRDRRSLATMFGVPLLLYPLLLAGTAGLTASTARRFQERVARVAVVNGKDAPGLLRRLQEKGSGVRLVQPPPNGARDSRALLASPRIDACRCRSRRVRARGPAAKFARWCNAPPAARAGGPEPNRRAVCREARSGARWITMSAT
jgi:hypothetical protein